MEAKPNTIPINLQPRFTALPFRTIVVTSSTEGSCYKSSDFARFGIHITV